MQRQMFSVTGNRTDNENYACAPFVNNTGQFLRAANNYEMLRLIEVVNGASNQRNTNVSNKIPFFLYHHPTSEAIAPDVQIRQDMNKYFACLSSFPTHGDYTVTRMEGSYQNQSPTPVQGKIYLSQRGNIYDYLVVDKQGRHHRGSLDTSDPNIKQRLESNSNAINDIVLESVISNEPRAQLGPYPDTPEALSNTLTLHLSSAIENLRRSNHRLPMTMVYPFGMNNNHTGSVSVRICSLDDPSQNEVMVTNSLPGYHEWEIAAIQGVIKGMQNQAIAQNKPKTPPYS